MCVIALAGWLRDFSCNGRHILLSATHRHTTPHGTPHACMQRLPRHATQHRTPPAGPTLHHQAIRHYTTETKHGHRTQSIERAWRECERKGKTVTSYSTFLALSCPDSRQTLTTRACSEESFDVRVKVGLVLIIFFLRRDEIHPIKRREVNRGRCLVRRCSCRRPRNARRPTATSGRGRWG